MPGQRPTIKACLRPEIPAKASPQALDSYEKAGATDNAPYPTLACKRALSPCLQLTAPTPLHAPAHSTAPLQALLSMTNPREGRAHDPRPLLCASLSVLLAAYNRAPAPSRPTPLYHYSPPFPPQALLSKTIPPEERTTHVRPLERAPLSRLAASNPLRR
jgi:hypothetical protein